jgi:para-nitrobenzyl esterase
MFRCSKFLWCQLFIIVLISCTSVNDRFKDQLVTTKYGRLKGVLNENGTVISFKGIPYAAPPVGDLRWREPQPPAAWEGIRDAKEFCSSCIQNRVFTHLPHGPWTEEFMVQDSISEDCLFLNLWAPVNAASVKLPVMVYIHGGAFTEGSGSVASYDGEELAAKGIIVITINYRLGALGFLAHPELSAESPHHVSGNYGLLDQVAALEWIRDNIEVFDGDPSRVTIVGQSAGASSVMSLIISPLAKGLFSGAITQSGSSLTGIWGDSKTLAQGEKEGVEFMKVKGAASMAELRAMSPLQIIAKMPEGTGIRFGDILDGYFQADEPVKIFDEGKQNDVAFLTGMNADETWYRGSTADDFKVFFPFISKEEADSAAKLAGQEQTRLDTWLWLEYRAKTSKTSSYEYFFDRAIPWPEHPEFGAFHTGEVPYVFNNLKKLRGHILEQADTIVADRVSAYWVNFVKTGDPNGPGLPRWDPFNGAKHEAMELGVKMGMMPLSAGEERLNYLKQQLLAPSKDEK